MNLLVFRKINLLFSLYLFLILSDWLGKFISIPLGSRHLLILILPIFAISSFKAERRTLMYFFSLTLVAILSFGYGNADFFNFSIGYLFTFLFFIVHIIFYNINISNSQLIKLLKYIVHANLILALPTLIGGLSDFDLRNHAGVFREVGAFATTMMCSQIICLFLYRVTYKQKYFNFAVIFSVICLLTILKKTMFLSLFVWALYALFYLNWRQWFLNPKLWFIGITVSSIMFAPLVNNLSINAAYLSNVGVDAHVRLGMYVTAIKLSQDFAPLGSGLGTFGSLGSIINNPIAEGKFDYRFNEIYYTYNIDSLAGNSEERAREGGMTILDTYWPHILGELGVFGLVGIFWFWAGKVLFLIRRKNTFNTMACGGAFYICAVYSAAIGEGLALIQPELPFFIFFHAGIGGLFLRLISDNNMRKYDS